MLDSLLIYITSVHQTALIALTLISVTHHFVVISKFSTRFIMVPKQFIQLVLTLFLVYVTSGQTTGAPDCSSDHMKIVSSKSIITVLIIVLIIVLFIES